MNFLIWIILAIVALIIFAYNNLISLKNKTKTAWSDIDVQLKRRHNLIPSLIETVKGYAFHERGVFEKVTEARTKALGAKNPKEAGGAEKNLSENIKTLFAVAENYPQLKASENFRKLHEDLTDTEDKIQSARRFYNGNVRDFNTRQEQFPYNLIAKIFSFRKAEFFEIEEVEEREVPEAKF